MEKPNAERNGGAGGLMRLPIGFRFRPTDEELVVQYLKRKLHSLPLPASVIPELDVFRTNPWDLPGDLRENRYFFYHRNIGKEEDAVKKCTSNTGSIIRRGVVGLLGVTTCGYWKASGGFRQILASGPVSGSKHQVIGMRRSLAFYFHQGNRRSEWVMREYYCLVGSPPTPPPHATHDLYHQNLKTQLLGNWVVCRIRQKKRRNVKCRPSGGSSSNNINRSTAPPATENIRKELISRSTIWNFNAEDFEGPPRTPLSSCSSGITEIPSNYNLDSLQDQEASSNYTNSKSKGAY